MTLPDRTKIYTRHPVEDPWVEIPQPSSDDTLWPDEKSALAIRRSAIESMRAVGPEHTHIVWKGWQAVIAAPYAEVRDLMMDDSRPCISLLHYDYAATSPNDLYADLRRKFRQAAEKEFSAALASLSVEAYVRPSQSQTFMLHRLDGKDVTGVRINNSCNGGNVVVFDLREGASPFGGEVVMEGDISPFREACYCAFSRKQDVLDYAAQSLSRFDVDVPRDTAARPKTWEWKK